MNKHLEQVIHHLKIQPHWREMPNLQQMIHNPLSSHPNELQWPHSNKRVVVVMLGVMRMELTAKWRKGKRCYSIHMTHLLLGTWVCTEPQNEFDRGFSGQGSREMFDVTAESVMRVLHGNFLKEHLGYPYKSL